MERKELVLNKLHSLPEEEMKKAIKQLTLHVQARMRKNSLLDRTKWGAHTEQNLGMDPVQYYVGESIKRLFDPDGWDWKFEKFTLVEQLTRIANKLISDQVETYKRNKEENPVFINKDIGEIYDLGDKFSDEPDDSEEICDNIIRKALELSQDDENLFFFTTLYFDGKDHPTIAKELGISIDDVYVLRKKIVRRLIKNKENLI